METTAKYWVIRNADNSVIHYGENVDGGKTVTGQPIVEEFEKKDNFINRLNELNINTDGI